MPKEEEISVAGPSPDRFFDTEHLKGDLKGRSIRSGAVTMSGQAVKFFLRMGSFAVLGRLLTPGEFGLVAMVTVVTEFALMFRDMGLSTATIQRPEVSGAQVSTLFWVNAGIGAALAAITALLAPVLVWWNAEPDLIKITPVLAIGLILGGLAIQHEALLKRQMRFSALATIEVASVAVGIAMAIVSALLGAGYWSLVVMHVAMSAAMTLGVWMISGWRPGRPRLRCGVRSMLSFGRDIVAYRIVNYLGANTDKFLLGRYWGRDVLGLYGRAYGLLMLPITQITWPITTVALPAMSRILDEPKKYARYYARLVQLLAFVTMPLVVLLAVCSRSVILLVLGEQWTEASRIFQILAVTAFIQPLSSTIVLVLLSQGLSGRLLKFGALNSSFIVVAFIIGIRWGAVGVASGYAVASYLVLFPGLWYSFRGTPVSIGTAVRAVWRAVIASGVMALALILVYPYLLGLANIAIFGIAFILAAFVYLLVWIFIPGGIDVLRDFAGYIALIYQKRESGESNQRGVQ